MAQLPILPLKTDALLGDTAHMSAEQFGGYVRILLTMWRHGGRLPDNEAELARIAGLSLRRWRTVKEAILRPLTIAGGVISQKRLTSTWLDVQELRAKRAHAAAVRHGHAHAGAHAEQVDSMCTAIQNQNQKEILSYVPPKQRPLFPVTQVQMKPRRGYR